MGNDFNAVIQRILPVIKPGDPALEKWLKTEVIASLVDTEADPSRRLSVSQVRSKLAEKHKEAVKLHKKRVGND
jgi:hypothetical protein